MAWKPLSKGMVNISLRRLSKSLKRFLAAKKHDIPYVGFPRFKKPHRWHSIQLRQYGTESNRRDVMLASDTNHLSVPAKIGKSIEIKLHRPLEGTPITLRRKQRALCRRKKGSHRRRKAAKSVAQTHLKIHRQRRDFHFKGAKQFTDTHSIIVVENLCINTMVRNHSLAKSIMDARWGAFLAILSVKAENAGHRVVRVNPRSTSQKCRACGAIVQKTLSVRTHMCPFCGSVADRDVNAAKNILQSVSGQGMAIRSQRTGVPAASPEKPLASSYGELSLSPVALFSGKE